MEALLKFSGYLFVVLLSISKNEVSAVCLFPPEFEGEYIIQNAAISGGNDVQYSSINITADWIFPYGQCYSRNDSNVIVDLSTEDNSCYRCFKLQMVSKNIILLIHNEVDINSKCSSSAETVKCPSEMAFNEDENLENDFHSIILYRTTDRDGPRRNEFCPFDFFDGEIKFDYYLDGDKVCSGYESVISQCPSSSSLSLRYKGCSYILQSFASYECIGSWTTTSSAKGVNFLALIEWINGTLAKYKCGTYRYENDEKSEITLNITNDCSSLTGRGGFLPLSKNQQTFKIKKVLHESKSTKMESLEFPPWLQGQWQFIDVEKGQLVYRDQNSFKSYRMNLVNQLNEDKFIVLSRSQCGEESFKCLWVRKLDANLLEFQMSSESTEKLTSFVFCNSAENFDNSRWLTQSRIGKDVRKTSCPISGKYIGRLPDDLKLCSVMISHCNSDVMHFQIGPCDSSDVYEKRVYRCLGQWTDDKSTYTFTKRIDVVNTYECFVGLMAGSENQIIIREAGDNCFKMLDPTNYGMEMNKTEKCRDESSLDEEIIVNPTHKDHSITYETVFDEENNNIDFNTITTSTAPPTTKRIKPTRKHINHHENSVENDISYEPTMRSAASSMAAMEKMIYTCGLALIICNVQNSIIINNIL